MNNLTGNWAGRIFGTNTGNLFLELEQSGARISGRARVLDNQFGLVIYSVTGDVDSNIAFTATPEKHPEGIVVGVVTVEAAVRQDGAIAGKWESAIGTAGTFEAFPHGKVGDTPASRDREVPEQVFNRTVEIGSVRLFQDDLKGLITILSKDFVHARPVATFNLRGSEVTKFADAFLSELKNLPQLRSLKINIQEPEPNGINRVVTIQLTQHSGSYVSVSGSNESWVVGKAESTAKALAPYQNNVITNYRKYGLEVNGIIFFLMLVVIPEIKDWSSRLVFVLVVMGLLFALVSTHRKLVPNTVVFTTEAGPTKFRRIWPSIVSWLIAATSSIFAMWVYSLLTTS